MISASEPGAEGAVWARTRVFRRLHPGLQAWITEQRWTSLRPLQVAAADHVFSSSEPLIISAGVASGKTEAAFLPLLTALPAEPGFGFEVLYVAPLVALIDDQARRLEPMARAVGRKVTPWHGDIAQSVKAAAKKAPHGILLITPESLESYLTNHALKARMAFGALKFIVIDELHAFLNGERGKQFQSVLARLETHCGCRPMRIGLSATLGDIRAAQAWLAADGPDRVMHIGDPAPRRPADVELFGICEPAPVEAQRTRRGSQVGRLAAKSELVAGLAGRVLRGKHLIFANGRKKVEEVVDDLRPALEALGSPSEVYAHHGNIAKTGKKTAEKSLHEVPHTCLVCTSTLELGIDVPLVSSVAQIGPPPAVASMKQRAGRSGRGTETGYLHIYCAERDLTGRCSLSERLRPRLVQAIAMVELMREGWTEPPDADAPHLSTLLHQVLAYLLQTSGATPREIWSILCQGGAFRSVDWALFRQLLVQMKAGQLIRQDDDGPAVHLDAAGARMATHYTFPVIFETPKEWHLVAGGKPIGTLPRILPTLPNDLLIFAGRRWQVVAVDANRHILEVKPSKSGVAPDFGGELAAVHDQVRQRMRQVYASAEHPDFCRGAAGALLEEARAWFASAHLAMSSLVEDGADTLMFHWKGDRAAATLKVMLAAAGVRAVEESVCLRIVQMSPAAVAGLLATIAAEPAPDPVEMAMSVPNKVAEKYDKFLGEALLSVEHAHRVLDVVGAIGIAKAVSCSAAIGQNQGLYNDRFEQV